MLKKLLLNQANSIASAAVIVASFSVLSRIFGFIRDRILAGAFGASDELDIYLTAFRVPDLLFQIVVVGALSASFIPLFMKYYGKDAKEQAWDLTSNVLNIVVLIFGFVVIVAVISAGPLATLVAPGFSLEKQMAVAELSRVMFLAQLLLAVSMIFGSVLQGTRRFLLYSLAPILYNVGIIIGITIFVPIMGLIGLSWGVVLGAFLHMLIQLLGVWTLGYKWRWMIVSNKDTRYMMTHSGPRVVGLAVNQLNFIGMTFIATLLASGSVTMFTFAYTLDYFPIGVFAVSYAIVAFPTLCEQAENKKAFVETFSSAIRQMMLFIIPSTVIFFLLRAQIVRLVYGAGLFDWSATITTADTLAFFVLSLFAQASVFLLVRAFFALDNTMTPFIVGLISAMINIVLGLFFSREYGVVGLGIAYSFSSIVQMALLWMLLRRKTETLDEQRIFISVGKLSIAALVMGLIVQVMERVVVRFISLETFMGVLTQFLIAAILGGAIYAGIAMLLRSEEMETFISGMRRKFFKRAKPEEPMVTELS